MTRVLVALCLAAGLASVAAHAKGDDRAPCADCAKVRVWTIRYRAHDGHRRHAHVVLPASYGPAIDREAGVDPALPLVIAPHGRGLHALSEVQTWDKLPALGGFAVVSPEGQGRRLRLYSWGYPGQIADLARMPRIVERALPWLRIDRRRVYAIGSSMGGQEALLLLGRYPGRVAGVAAFDAAVDMALRYRDFSSLPCNAGCRYRWTVPMGKEMQKLARVEIGGRPKKKRRAYALRSPLTYARTIASSGVPVQLWWSHADRVVTRPGRHSRRLFRELKRLNPRAPVTGFVGTWAHSSRKRTLLPIALAEFGLLPPSFAQPPLGFPLSVYRSAVT